MGLDGLRRILAKYPGVEQAELAKAIQADIDSGALHIDDGALRALSKHLEVELTPRPIARVGAVGFATRTQHRNTDLNRHGRNYVDVVASAIGGHGFAEQREALRRAFAARIKLWAGPSSGVHTEEVQQAFATWMCDQIDFVRSEAQRGSTIEHILRALESERKRFDETHGQDLPRVAELRIDDLLNNLVVTQEGETTFLAFLERVIGPLPEPTKFQGTSSQLAERPIFVESVDEPSPAALLTHLRYSFAPSSGLEAMERVELRSLIKGAQARLRRSIALLEDARSAPSKEERLRLFKKSLRQFFVAMPYTRGSASMGQALFNGCAQALFGHPLPYPAGRWDVLANCAQTDKEFLEWVEPVFKGEALPDFPSLNDT
jgi:hypothetical protein